MALIHYQGTTFTCRPEETVLDAALRQGVSMPFSCRNGACHVCIQQCIHGVVPAAAQKGLGDRRKEQGYFLPCRCRPVTDMTIVSAAPAEAERLSKSPSGAPAKLAPDAEMWEALGRGTLLSAILDDFYSRVYADERLSPFFHEVTKQRSIEKQYLFLRQVFTGEKVYFGDRPRNAHHWMVVSDELFDYRAKLMRDCLNRAGLAAHLVERWISMEERFRPEIVKDQPWRRVMNGTELPLDGFDEETLEVGSLCDGCGDEIAAGARVRYHLRLGKTYCAACR